MKKIIKLSVIIFDWDDGNKYKNAKKHDVSIRESEEVFFNKPIFFFEDYKHSKVEKRVLALGRTNNDRLLSVIFTLRNDKLRIISVRDMSKKERSVYEKKQKNSQIFF